MTFEKDVKFLTNCSKQFKAQMKAQGREVVSDGWFCDENGNWGGWVITKNSDKSSFLKKMSDHTNEILEKKLANKTDLRGFNFDLQEEMKNAGKWTERSWFQDSWN